jgi:8-oxo-dGTP pyrophosphatase MutT (NUDIX family)
MDIVASEVVQKYRVFTIRKLVVRVPDSGDTQEYHVIERPDSVQVIALTSAGRMLLVEQERQGTQQSSLEFVAGMIDAGEDARAAAARELEEETGYRAAELQELGWYYTDPAILTNKVTVFLADGCTRTGEVKQDEGEDVHARLYDVEAIPGLIASSRISHGLCVAAWHLYQSRVQRSRSRT